MIVQRHAEASLRALAHRLPVTHEDLVARLRRDPDTSSKAIELCRLQFYLGSADSSNGDSVVAVCREGTVVTAMLRRSYQPFTPEALRVDHVESWEGDHRNVR